MASSAQPTGYVARTDLSHRNISSLLQKMLGGGLSAPAHQKLTVDLHCDNFVAVAVHSSGSARSERALLAAPSYPR